MECNVTGCVDCPLCGIDFGIQYYCNHPDVDDEHFFIDIDENENPVTPINCPLNSYPLMIKNKNWQSFEYFWKREN